MITKKKLYKILFPSMRMSLKHPYQTLNSLLSIIGMIVGVIFLLRILTPSPDFKEVNALDWSNAEESAKLFMEYYTSVKESADYSGEMLLTIGDKSYQDGTTSNLHPLGSISKPITAHIFNKFQQEELLSNEDSVCKYIDSFCVGQLKSITLEYLITHKSGLRRDKIGLIPNLLELLFGIDVQYSEIVNSINEKDLISEPGEKFNYSNLGFETLSIILQKVSMPFFEKVIAELSAQEIFRVEDVDSPNYIEPKLAIPLFSHKYTLKPSFSYILPLLDRKYLGAGGAVASVSSLTSWMKAQDFSKNPAWAKLEDVHGNEVYWHNGSYVGVSSFSLAIPSLDIYFAVIGDTSFTPITKKLLNSNLINIFSGKNYQTIK